MQKQLPSLALLVVLAVLSAACREFPDRSSDVSRLPGKIIRVEAREFYFEAPDTIDAGLVTFELVQTGLVAERLRAGAPRKDLFREQGDGTHGLHMLWLVRLDSSKTTGDFVLAERDRLPRPWARNLGGPGFAHPPLTTNATFLLEPGSYALVCTVGDARADRTRNHILKGMVRPLVVRPSTQAIFGPPESDLVARIAGPGRIDFSAPPQKGRHTVRVDNLTTQDSELWFELVPAGMTGEDFVRLEAYGTSWAGLASIPPGATLYTTINFEPGVYVVGTQPSMRPDNTQLVTVAR